MRQMLLDEIVVNPSVAMKDEKRLLSQNTKVYLRLLKGSATNDELQIVSRSRNISARISDVRLSLEKVGQTVKMIKELGGGVNLYAIVNL